MTNSAIDRMDQSSMNAGEAPRTAATPVREKVDAVRAAAGEAIDTAREKVADAYDAVREKSSAAYTTAKAKADGAIDSAKAGAATARRKTAEGIEGNPLAALAGGLALGTLVGALLPRTERETEALGPIGSKITGAAKEAMAAAKDAGARQLDELGVNREAARAQADKLAGAAAKVASTASAAAIDAVKKK